MSTQTFPNGQSLVSSAFNPDTFANLFQGIIASIFGFDVTDPTQAPTAYSQVRVGWPPGGQPAWEITDDVCFVSATLENAPFARVRDSFYAHNDSVSLSQQMGFTQVWNLQIVLYGPDSADRGRLILSAIQAVDFVHDALEAKNVYLVVAPDRPTYTAENFQGQWWRRADLQIQFNELVTESIVVPSAAGVDVTLIKENGLTTEIVIGTV